MPRPSVRSLATTRKGMRSRSKSPPDSQDARSSMGSRDARTFLLVIRPGTRSGLPFRNTSWNGAECAIWSSERDNPRSR